MKMALPSGRRGLSAPQNVEVQRGGAVLGEPEYDTTVDTRVEKPSELHGSGMICKLGIIKIIYIP